MSTETNVPTNHIDIDSADAQKLFADAFKEARGVETPAHTPVIETPTVVSEAKVDVPAEPVVETPKPDVAVEKKDTPAPPEPEKKEEVQARSDLPEWASKLDPALQENIREVLTARQTAEHKARSNAGRQAALQRQIYERDRRISELVAKMIKPSDNNQIAAGKEDSAKTLEAWKQLNEAEPGIANAVDSRIKALEDQLNQKLAANADVIKATTDPLYQQRETEYREQQQQILADAIPNYADVINHTAYKYWFDRYATPGLRQIANTSNDAQDAITVLNLYGQWASNPTHQAEMIAAGALKAEEVQQPQAPQVQTQPVVVDSSQADRVARSREQKVAAAPVVPTAPSPVTPASVGHLANSRPGESVDLDSDAVAALFAEAYKKNKR